MKLSHGALTLAFVPLVFFSSAGACAVFPSLNYYLAWMLSLALFALLSGWHLFGRSAEPGLIDGALRGFLLTVGVVALLSIPVGLLRWDLQPGEAGVVYRLDRLTGRVYSRLPNTVWTPVLNAGEKPEENEHGDKVFAP